MTRKELIGLLLELIREVNSLKRDPNWPKLCRLYPDGARNLATVKGKFTTVLGKVRSNKPLSAYQIEGVAGEVHTALEQVGVLREMMKRLDYLDPGGVSILE